MQTEMITETGYVKNDKERNLHYEYIHPIGNEASSCVIIGHGYDGHNQRPYVKKVKDVCHKMNVATLAFDLTGCGKSQGQLSHLTPKNARHDWKTMVEFSRTLDGVDPQRRAAFGTSFSANALMEYAASDEAQDLQALIFHVPVPKWKKIIEFALQAQVMLSGKDLKKLDANHFVPVFLGDLELHVTYPLIKQLREMNLYEEAAPHITTPVTIIGGEKDGLVSPKKLHKLAEAFPKEASANLQIIKKATHSFNDEQLEHMGKIAAEALSTAFSEKKRVPLLKAI